MTRRFYDAFEALSSGEIRLEESVNFLEQSIELSLESFELFFLGVKFAVNSLKTKIKKTTNAKTRTSTLGFAIVPTVRFKNPPIVDIVYKPQTVLFSAMNFQQLVDYM